MLGLVNYLVPGKSVKHWDLWSIINFIYVREEEVMTDNLDILLEMAGGNSFREWPSILAMLTIVKPYKRM